MNPKEIVDEKKLSRAAKRRKERKKGGKREVAEMVRGKIAGACRRVTGWAGDDKRGLLVVVSAHAETPEISYHRNRGVISFRKILMESP
jgi:hypothetical protein